MNPLDTAYTTHQQTHPNTNRHLFRRHLRHWAAHHYGLPKSVPARAIAKAAGITFDELCTTYTQNHTTPR